MKEGPLGDDGLDFLEDGPTDEEVHAVERIIRSFLIALKSYALYPEGHTISQKSLETVGIHLDRFLTDYGDLKLDVQKDCLLFQGQVVYQASSEEENLPFLLFRDGIQSLHFQKDLERWEVATFFRILSQYRNPPEDAESDLVTALWEAPLPHLQHEATDVFWEAEVLTDFSLFKVTDEQRQDTAQQEDEQEQQTISLSIAAPGINAALWELTPQEAKQVQGMVLEEEKKDRAPDMLGVLLVILKELCNEEEFTTILESLKEEFQTALAEAKFQSTYKILETLHEIRHSCDPGRTWVIPLLEHLFMAVSSPETLNVLQSVWPNLQTLESNQVEMLRQSLLLLPPEAILALGPLLPIPSPLHVQQITMETIGFLAIKDLHPLEQLLDQSVGDEGLVQRLVYILRHLKGKRPFQLLLKMLQHPSERVRKESLKAVVHRDPNILQELFSMIEDSSKAIRWLMLQYLGERRSEPTEKLLRDYLEKRRFQIKEREHLLSCYKALGRCGSGLSIPFLRQALLNRGWMPGFERSTHRQGAVLALLAIEAEEAKEILKRASQSLFPGVRLAYQKALKDNK